MLPAGPISRGNAARFETRIGKMATAHGETDNFQNYDVNNLGWNVIENGGIDTTTETIYSPLENSVRWHPSTGFILFFISSLLDFTYRNRD